MERAFVNQLRRTVAFLMSLTPRSSGQSKLLNNRKATTRRSPRRPADVQKCDWVPMAILSSRFQFSTRSWGTFEVF